MKLAAHVCMLQCSVLWCDTIVSGESTGANLQLCSVQTADGCSIGLYNPRPPSAHQFRSQTELTPEVWSLINPQHEVCSHPFDSRSVQLKVIEVK